MSTLPPSVAKLFRALEEGDKEGFEELLASDPSLLKARDELGRSLPLVAMYTGQAELAMDLVRRGAPEGIHEAAALGDLREARTILDRDPTAGGRFAMDGWTPLHLSVFFGHAEVSELLLDRGADPSAVSKNSLANQPLHAAVAGGHAHVVRLLVERRADVRSARCQGGVTPLHLAAEIGEFELIEPLLDAGAEVGVRNEHGATPVDIARASGHEPVVALLLRHGARDLLPPQASSRPRSASKAE